MADEGYQCTLASYFHFRHRHALGKRSAQQDFAVKYHPLSGQLNKSRNIITVYHILIINLFENNQG